MAPLARLLRNTSLTALVLLAMCAALMLPGLGQGIVTRESELRVLHCARTMADGGSWLIPNYLGEERLRKPPMMYWIVAGAFELCGSTSNEAAARAASAAAATALVLTTYFAGRRLIGRRGAFFSAIVLATSIGFVRHARLAETDMAQSLFTALAIVSGYAAVTSAKPLRWWLAFGAAAGTGFMFKGPASIAMPVAALVVFVLCEQFGRSGRRRLAAGTEGHQKLRLRMSWPGLLIAAILFTVIVAPWYVAVALKTTDNTSYQATDELSRLLVESHHPGPFVYYLYMLPLRMGFWGLLIPVAIYAAFRFARHHRGMQLVLGWFASSFIILSALQSKQQHYALLLFAPAALLCGWLLARASRLPVTGKDPEGQIQALENSRRRDLYARYARGYVRWLCALAVIVGVVIIASQLFPIPEQHVALRDAAMPVAVVCTVMGIAGFIFCHRRLVCGLTVITAIYALMVAVQVTTLEKHQNGLTIIREFAGEQRDTLQRAGRLFVGGPRASVIAWYAERDITLIDQNTAAAAWRAAQPGDVLIASDKPERPRIAPQIPAVPAAVAERLEVRLSLYIKPGPAL